MTQLPLTPREAAELDKARDEHRAQQPYAGELDDHELEQAHKEDRPVDPKGKAAQPPKRS